jgi:hypothetical protein
MRPRKIRFWPWLFVLLPLLLAPVLEGCQAISDHLSRWNMLGQEALDNPVQAVGGDAFVFSPPGGNDPPAPNRLEKATTEELVAYYAPIFIQQKVDTSAQRYPYPPEYDQIGEARLEREADGKFKAAVSGPPTVYAIYQEVALAGQKHIQLTYTAWYPAHPRMKAVDLEKAAIDSCVLRVTLDSRKTPLFYETIAACGCFHKAFVQRRVEEASARAFGPPEGGKKYSVEKSVKDSIDWEVAGIVDEPPDRPARPVVFLKAGDHKVLGVGSASRLRVPGGADVRTYALTEYANLYSVAVAGGTERAPFFDVDNGGKVWGAERKERFILSLVGVDDAGHPRSLDQIKLHFDQSTWGDPNLYSKYLRLAPGTL